MGKATKADEYFYLGLAITYLPTILFEMLDPQGNAAFYMVIAYYAINTGYLIFLWLCFLMVNELLLTSVFILLMLTGVQLFATYCFINNGYFNRAYELFT